MRGLENQRPWLRRENSVSDETQAKEVEEEVDSVMHKRSALGNPVLAPHLIQSAHP